MTRPEPRTPELLEGCAALRAQAAYLTGLGKGDFCSSVVAGQVVRLAAAQLIIQVQALVEDLPDIWAVDDGVAICWRDGSVAETVMESAGRTAYRVSREDDAARGTALQARELRNGPCGRRSVRRQASRPSSRFIAGRGGGLCAHQAHRCG